MTMFSSSGTDDLPLDVLWEDGERIFCRTWRVDASGERKEIMAGGDGRRVVTQEGPPSLAGRPPPFDHVLADGRLRDLKPEFEQLAVNAWRAPERIFDADSPDQSARLRVDLRPPSQ